MNSKSIDLQIQAFYLISEFRTIKPLGIYNKITVYKYIVETKSRFVHYLIVYVKK